MHPNALWFDVAHCLFLFFHTLIFLTTLLLTYFPAVFDLVAGGV